MLCYSCCYRISYTNSMKVWWATSSYDDRSINTPHSLPFLTWFPQTRSQILTARLFNWKIVAYSHFTQKNDTNLTSSDSPMYVPLSCLQECAIHKYVQWLRVFNTFLNVPWKPFWKDFIFQLCFWWMIHGFRSMKRKCVCVGFVICNMYTITLRLLGYPDWGYPVLFPQL
jgi:hypothetical protein